MYQSLFKEGFRVYMGGVCTRVHVCIGQGDVWRQGELERRQRPALRRAPHLLRAGWVPAGRPPPPPHAEACLSFQAEDEPGAF